MAMNKDNIVIVSLQSAETGTIYEFLEKDGTSNKKVLVVQNEKRSEDNLVSILMLGTKTGMPDTIPIELNGTTYYVHCGMLTYCRRLMLGRKCGKVDDQTIARIRRNIAYQLGIAEEVADYKELYNSLLNKVITNFEKGNIDIETESG